MKILANLSPLLAMAFILGGCAEPQTGPPAAETDSPEKSAQPKEDPTPNEVVAAGVFNGRSGKPMAGAKLYLAELERNEMLAFAKLTLASGVSTAVVDREGRFQIKGFKPGTYTLIYEPPGVEALLPNSISIIALSATKPSMTPGLKDVELGTTKPFSSKDWGSRFTLLEGHTLHSEGKTMVIRNATVRYGQQGPYIEVRRGAIWKTDFEDNSEIQFDAWSY